MAVTQLLAHQFVHPLGRLAAIVGLHAWDDERHFAGLLGCECGFQYGSVC